MAVDQELIAYLDERFRETSRQIERLREETHQQFAAVDQRFAAVNQRLDTIDRRLDAVDQRLDTVDQRLDTVDRRLDTVDQRFVSFRDEVAERFERIDGEIRRTQVLLEDLRHETHIVAEGVVGGHDKLASYQSETRLEFDDVKGSIGPYYRDLNRRLIILEERADRETRDIMEVIRQKFVRRAQAL